MNKETSRSDDGRYWAANDPVDAKGAALAAVAALHQPSEHVTIAYASHAGQAEQEWEQVAVEHPDGTTTSLEPTRIRCDQCHCAWPCATAATTTPPARAT